VNCERLPEALAISNSEAKRWFRPRPRGSEVTGLAAGEVQGSAELRIRVPGRIRTTSF